eukprot:6172105-Pleurochrysis_carterae.AAC.1
MREAIEAAGGTMVTFAQCALGAGTRKYTTLALAAGAARHAAPLAAAQCTHGASGHDGVAYGRDEHGAPRARAAAAYPAGMNIAIANMLLSATADQEPAAQRHMARLDATGGRVGDGPSLSASIRARIAEARTAPPAFASLRNLAPEDANALAAEPMPDGLLELQPAEPPRKSKRAKRRRALPGAGDGPTDTSRGAGGDGNAAERPPGPIAIADLFLPGVYADKVQSWLAAADAA